QLAQLGEHFGGEVRVRRPLGGVRFDLLGGEVPAEALQCFGLLGQVEVHHRSFGVSRIFMWSPTPLSSRNGRAASVSERPSGNICVGSSRPVATRSRRRGRSKW